MDGPRRAAVWSGLASSALGFGATLLAVARSPRFAWSTSALSDLGAAGEPTALLFNGGLVLAGLIGLPFGWVLVQAARNHLERIAGALFAGSVTALALVGGFPTGTDPHFPVAVAYFLLFTLAMGLHGAGAALAGDRRRGLASIGLGVAHVLAWLALTLAGPPGLAIPEIVGSALLLAWVLLTTRWLRAEAPYA